MHLSRVKSAVLGINSSSSSSLTIRCTRTLTQVHAPIHSTCTSSLERLSSLCVRLQSNGVEAVTSLVPRPPFPFPSLRDSHPHAHQQERKATQAAVEERRRQKERGKVVSGRKALTLDAPSSNSADPSPLFPSFRVCHRAPVSWIPHAFLPLHARLAVCVYAHP